MASRYPAALRFSPSPAFIALLLLAACGGAEAGRESPSASGPASTSPAPAGLELRFDETVETTPLVPGEEVRVTHYSPSGGDEPEGRSQSIITVGLTPDYVYVVRDGERTVYDFVQHRVHQQQTEARTYWDSSLYAMVALRSGEFRNRIFIQDALEAAGGKVDGALFLSAMENETTFGMEHGDAGRRRIEEARDGEWILYGWDGKTRVDVRPSEHEVPEFLHESFERYLVHECTLHPEIRRRTLAARRFPAELRYHYASPGAETDVRLVLKSVEEGAAEDLPLPAGFRRAGDPGEEILEITQAVRDGTTEIPRLSGEVSRRIAEDALQAGNGLEAFLAMMEFVLQEGETPEAMLPLLRRAVQIDPVPRVWQAIQINQGETQAQALQILDGIDRTGLTRPHVMDTWRAVALTGMGRQGEAQALLLEALHANPYLVGAYKDLGDLYFAAYETTLAWECWDTARFIAPGHYMLQHIGEHEASLAEDHPEFF